MPQPKVAVCIPAYEQTTFLRKTLESVRIQDYDHYEVVVTDDSSSDAVAHLMSEFDDLPIRYHRNSVTLGSPRNWNHCIGLAESEYIKVLHHDDWFAEPHSLSAYVMLLDRDPTASFAFSASYGRAPDADRPVLHRPSEAQLRKLRRDSRCVLFGNFIGSPSATIFRREQFVPYDERLTWLVDVDQYAKIISRKRPFAYCEKPLIESTYDSPHQLTASLQHDGCNEVREYLQVYDTHYLAPGRHTNVQVASHLIRLFRRHGVIDEGSLRDCGCTTSTTGTMKVMLRIARTLRSSTF